MANGNTAYVPFVNQTNEVVTFIMEFPNDVPRFRFTLRPGGTHNEPVPNGTPGGTAVTDQNLRLVVGADANGRWTNNIVTVTELIGLEQVIVTMTGDDFHLDPQPRRTWQQKASDYVKRFLRSGHGHGPARV